MREQLRNPNNSEWPERPRVFPDLMTPAFLPDGNGGFTPCPELLIIEKEW